MWLERADNLDVSHPTAHDVEAAVIGSEGRRSERPWQPRICQPTLLFPSRLLCLLCKTSSSIRDGKPSISILGTEEQERHNSRPRELCTSGRLLAVIVQSRSSLIGFCSQESTSAISEIMLERCAENYVPGQLGVRDLVT